jgi:hypothetical protein
LIGCGVMLLLVALMFLGMTGMMVLTLFVPTPQRAPVNVIGYTAILYLALTALFAFLGMGSILARRWSRPLILVVSWGWLFCGVIGAAMLAFVLPQALDQLPERDPGIKMFATGCVIFMFAIFGILVPLAFALFYRRAEVKRTLEVLDPVPRWTDQHPTPLLGYVVWMSFGAVSVVLSMFSYRALPVGSILLPGWAAKVVMLVMAALMVWIAYGFLKRIKAAWWTAIAFLVIGILWGISLTVSKVDWAAAINMPADPGQTAMMDAMYNSPFFYAWMGVVWLAYFAFVWYLRRYFPPSERSAVQTPVDLQ